MPHCLLGGGVLYLTDRGSQRCCERGSMCLYCCIAELGTKVRVHKSPVFTVHTVVVFNGTCMYCVVWGLFTVNAEFYSLCIYI